MEQKQRNTLLLGIICLFGLIALFVVISKQKDPEGMACTMEAKICPDGTSVGRTGPQCAFEACPSSPDITGWKTFSDTEENISFRYPETLETTYVTTSDWPPHITVINGPLTCNETGSSISTEGETLLRTINNSSYCVTAASEGAAGSMYTNYTYKTAVGSEVAVATFALRFVQCANFDEPKMSACKNEQTLFSIDQTIDTIISSIIFLSSADK